MQHVLIDTHIQKYQYIDDKCPQCIGFPCVTEIVHQFYKRF